ncbi:MAG: class I SAM-dependent methyltransferase, partial [Gammaproteobacteria bacterium]|nr:class I SAM-dependent methyltransferase [Gammaproteobacteria bacterium]
MQVKPFAESSEQNKRPILAVLEQLFVDPGQVFEIGSGTGQHAIYFTEQLAHLHWQPSDLADQIPGMQLWFDEASNARILPPLVVDVEAGTWPVSNTDYVFTANTLHIVSWSRVEAMFRGVGQLLKAGGLFAQYGPFNYGGQFTSESNARFDQWLKQRDPESGIRHFEDLA